MGFRDWPYWLRGGVIGGILPLFGYITYSFNPFRDSIFFRLIALPGEIVLYLFFQEGRFRSLLLTHFIINLLIYVIFGALIGFIIGKIKNRNQTQLNQNI